MKLVRQRFGAGAAAVAVQLALIAALLWGLRGDIAAPVAEAIQVFEVAPPPPPRTEPPRRATRPQGRAAPPARRARATPVAAPVPVIVLSAPPPIVAAPVPNLGAETTQGAATAGPGSGAGGQGQGTGTGGSGLGDGGGREIPLRLLSGRLRARDLPEAVLAEGVDGVVHMRFTVGIDGRVHDCRVTRSSGKAGLDAATCRLITDKFRYRPTRDASGRKVPDVVLGEQHWEER